MDVILIPAADDEFQALPEAERFAMGTAIAKLRKSSGRRGAYAGDRPPFAHEPEKRR